MIIVNSFFLFTAYSFQLVHTPGKKGMVGSVLAINGDLFHEQWCILVKNNCCYLRSSTFKFGNKKCQMMKDDVE